MNSLSWFLYLVQIIDALRTMLLFVSIVAEKLAKGK